MACGIAPLEANYEDNQDKQSLLHGDWFTDPVQLAHWQGQLVESCHEISQQLSEIQNDLTKAKTPAIPFRLIKACAGA